jgi:predicted DNA binding CopG/RHH family protein
VGIRLHDAGKAHSDYLSPGHEPERTKGIQIMKNKTVPVFKNEDAERKFWAEQDSTEYLDWSKAKRAIFPNLKPSTKTISLRLPESLLESLKLLANKRDIPYQSLMKVFLVERIEQEIPPIGQKRRTPLKALRTRAYRHA